MTDRILERFLIRQLETGMQLSTASDLVELTPVGDPVPNRYLVELRCPGLVRDGEEIIVAHRFHAGVWFHDSYLRTTSTFLALTWFGPKNVVHPNIDPARRLICIGHLAPGTSLVDILHQLVAVVRYEEYNTADPLVPAICPWVLRNAGRFPLDRTPLKRRAVDVALEEIAG